MEDILIGYIPIKRSLRHSYTLDNIKNLLENLDNPQDKYKTIHIAGTSGKTSTAYFIASLLKQTGSKVGLTISPHVDSITERVQINLEPLKESDFTGSFNEFHNLIKNFNIDLTYFEVLVAFAFWEFARQKVDYAVVEVGIGGLLDGTNTITRKDKVSVITDIGLDHQEILGETIQEIALQKAGIMLPNSLAFCLKQDKEIIGVINDYAIKLKSNLNVIDFGNKRKSLNLYNLPNYQNRNWTLADATVSYLIKRDDLKKLTLEQKKEAATVYIPGRMELIKIKDKQVILDAAHNPQKIQALVSSLEEKDKLKKYTVILSLINSNNIRIKEILQIIKPITNKLYITQFKTKQSAGKTSEKIDSIRKIAREMGYEKIEIIEDSNKAIEIVKEIKDNNILVTGSLYLINDLHQSLKLLAEA